MSEVGLDRPGTPGRSETWDTEFGGSEASAASKASGESERAAPGAADAITGDSKPPTGEASGGAAAHAPESVGDAEAHTLVSCGDAEAHTLVSSGAAGAHTPGPSGDTGAQTPVPSGDTGAHTPEASEGADPHTPSAAAPRAPEVSTGRKPITPGPTRRSPADPVKALMHRHRELCERAVDPLEIAAGLEAHGVTDRTAVRFRHRDVFSLAEEMYARVPRDGETPPPPTAEQTPRARADWALFALLPGALCAATVAGIRLTDGQSRLVAALVGFLAVSLAMRAALSRGPLGLPDRAPATGTATWTYWLLAYAALGDGLLAAAMTGGPDALPTGAADAPWPMATAPVLALALSCAPAAWSAHLFAARARRKLTVSRGLEDFAASVRPLLLGTFALYLCALTVLSALSGALLDEPSAHPQVIALGALLFLARLLTVHRFTHAPAVVLTAAATAQATALAAAFASRLPGCGVLTAPVEALVDLWGAGGIQTLSCGIGALALLIHGIRKLTRASAHAQPEDPC
ncbi:hypothetical protein OG426_36225 [Streptomyces canus]|uniref:hypothetical protein n=1 Tax=Streptomyces canus TaxID=58343 RepID=UPI00224E3AF8|nr:hypothetical protein [Streptomyces canus]MCX4857121.1 hypothetical protein [Streptomyces canus]WSW37504.1 hypothetical protein OG426_36225 [Streptomyces canus]